MKGATRRLLSSRTLIVVFFAAAAALITGYGQVALGNLGHRIWYDDGVYMGAATRFSHGVVPYRDFVFLHPPGIILLLTPFAFVGRAVGTASVNEAARLLVLSSALAAVFLFARVVRARPNLAVTVGLTVFVLHPDAIVADQAVYLEPLLVAVCLVGTTLLFDGERLVAAHSRWWLGGAVFGLACAFKLWAVLPAAALVVVAVSARRWADAARLVLSAAGAFCLLCLPFLLLAPSAFVRYLFVVQASRTDPASATLTSRVGNLLFLPSRLLYVESELATNRVLVGALVVFVLGLVICSVARTRSQPLSALEWYSFVCVGLVVGAFLVAGDYFAHYGSFAAPYLGLVASGTTARLIAVDRRAAEAPRNGRLVRAAITAGVSIAVVLLVAYGLHILRVTTPAQKLSSSELTRIAAVVPLDRCVVTDNSSILLMSGRFTAARPGCPEVVDVFGTELALSDGRLDRASQTEELQQTWRSWLERADFLVLNEPDLASAAKVNGWNQRILRYARTHFSLVDRLGAVSIYGASGPTPASSDRE
jgi:hypothetical protein